MVPAEVLLVDLPASDPQTLHVFRETPGPDRRELLSVPAEPINWRAGSAEAVWLRVGSAGLDPGTHTVSVTLALGGSRAPLTVRARVWPVAVAAKRPFHVRGYCGGFPVWTKGYEVTEHNLMHLEAILAAFAEIGGDVIDWNGVWARLVTHVKIGGTDDMLADVAKETPDRVDLNELPRLDFSYYQPWLDLAKKHGASLGSRAT